MKKSKSSLIIADETTISILHHCFKIHELNDLDIGLVLNVNYPRQRVKIEPIYFLSPTEHSIKAMCMDFEDTHHPKYAAPIHCYFCSKVPSAIMNIVKTSNIVKYIKSFAEVHCDFLVFEQRVFTFNRKTSFDNLYIHKEKRTDELQRISQQLVSLCISINEIPYIRYSHRSRNAKSLASLIKLQFEDQQHLMKDWEPERNNATLIIMDRTDDVCTPLLHNLAYQPMIMDLLYDCIGCTKEQGVTIQIAKNEKPRKMPDDSDNIWREYRHLFIGDVVKNLPQAFEEWQNNNAVAKMKKTKKQNENGTVSSVVLIEAARDMPQYQKLVKSFTSHINMASKLSSMFSHFGLRNVVNIEQDLCTGINEEGQVYNKTRVQKTFCNEILMDAKKDILLKLRIFMLYVITQGGMMGDRRRQLLQQAGFDTESEKAITNLRCLGVDLRPQNAKSGANDETKSAKYWAYNQKIARSKSSTTSITRHTSYLEYVLHEHFHQVLDEKDFAWVKKPKIGGNQQKKVIHSYRKHAGGKNAKNKNKSKSLMINSSSSVARKRNQNGGEDERAGPRIIVYVLGGVSYAEIKSCYEFSLQENIDVFIGSTQVYSPPEYVELLKNAGNNVDDDEGGGRNRRKGGQQNIVEEYEIKDDQ